MKNILLFSIGTFALISSQIILNANINVNTTDTEKNETSYNNNYNYNQNNYNQNFKQRKTYFDDYLSTFTELPKGWKQIKREEVFWQDKITPEGNVVSPKLIVNEFQKALNKHKKQTNNNSFAAAYEWETLGPYEVPSINLHRNVGNGCICRIAIDPENENIIWIGAASGGIWKSEDKGNSWQEMPFADMLTSGIMDIAIAPSNPNIMYASSGSLYGSGLFRSFSIGILKSTDRGKSWNIIYETLDYVDSASFSRILIHPENPDIVYVGTTKSVLKTTNGGDNWREIIEGYYFRELKFKPNNPNVIYVCTQMPHLTGEAKIFVSEDAGDNWEMAKSFFHARRIELAVTPKNPELIYAITGHATEHGGKEGFYVSRTSGKNWDTLSHWQREDFLNFVYGQSYHNLGVAVSPNDENFVVAGGIYAAVSIDGGKTWKLCGSNVHPDVQHLLFTDTAIYCANDGGINWIHCDSLYNNFSDKEEFIWTNITKGLNISQYYRIGAHPYSDKFIITGVFDNGVHFFEQGKWKTISGGDGMKCQFNPKRPAEYYYSTQRGGGVSHDIDDSFIFMTNFIVSPLTPDTMLICGTNVWVRDLANPSSKPHRISNFVPNRPLRTIAISKSDKNYIYTSSDDNRLFYTSDYGTSWKEAYTSNPTITHIAVNPNNPEHFWISLGGHYKNEKVIEFLNGERKNISYDLPNVALNCIEYYPRENMLFVGTDIGIFALKDSSWQYFHSNLPYVSTSELEYVPTTGYMYAATWGRGAWRIKLHDCDAIAPTINTSIEAVKDSTIDGASTIRVCNSDLPVRLFNIDKKADYEYFWSNGSTADTLDIYQSGQFYLVGISPEGCSEISQVININVDFAFIDALIRLTTSLDRNPVCVGNTISYKYQVSTYGRAMGADTTNFQWSNGSKETTITISEPTKLSIYYTNPRGCVDTLYIDTIRFVDLPLVPQIAQEGNILVVVNNAASEQYSHFQWLLNGEEIEQAWEDFITITSLGDYQVIAWNENYCSETSDIYSINFNESEDNERLKVKLSPNPTSESFTLELFYSEGEMDINFEIYDNTGRRMTDFAISLKNYYTSEFNVLPFASGHYFIQLTSNNYSRTIPFVIAR